MEKKSELIVTSKSFENKGDLPIKFYIDFIYIDWVDTLNTEITSALISVGKMHPKKLKVLL